jgi:NADP-dependent 3-hydroxy acid dehydrogenase YdfG
MYNQIRKSCKRKPTVFVKFDETLKISDMKELDDYSPKSIAGKTIFVTGGTTGIGRATARILAGLGAKVFITGRHLEPLQEALTDTREMYPNCEIDGAISDLSDKSQIEAIFDAFREKYDTIDILVNNAGLGAEGMLKGDYEQWKYVLHTNLLNYMACSNAAAKMMKDKKSGHIVNVGSMSAETTEAESTVYVATKAGIRGFTQSLRKELNPEGIKVTLIEPGAVSSDMQPGGSEEHDKKIKAMEMLEAEDIAATVIFCLSQPERCNIVTVQTKPLKQII